MLATVAVGGGSRQRRVGEGHLGVVLDSVNTLFESFLNFFAKPQNSAVFPSSSLATPDGSPDLIFKYWGQIARFGLQKG